MSNNKKQRKPTQEELQIWRDFKNNVPVLKNKWPITKGHHVVIASLIKDVLSLEQVRILLARHVKDLDYLNNMTEFKNRYRLDGSEAEEITKEEKEQAKISIDNIKKAIARRKEEKK
jgi:sRNA-binding protein